MKLTIAAAVCAGLVLTACGSGTPPRPTPAPSSTPDLAAKVEVSDEQLLAMTLALEEYGPRYAIFGPSAGSGLQVLSTRALQGCDSIREGNALARYGWEKGYARFWISPDPDIPDTIAIGTYVDVYATSSDAREKLNYDANAIVDDARLDDGCFGIYAVEGVDHLAVSGIGEQSWGARERISFQGLRGSISFISFRRAHVVATVSIIRLTSEDSTEELTRLAQQVDAKIMPILSAPLSVAPASGSVLYE
jgi:hypothetical protein